MSTEKTLNIGFGNRAIVSRVVGVLVPGSSPIRRLREDAKKIGKLSNATHGRKCRSILIMDSGHLILSSVHADTLCSRFEAISFEPEENGSKLVASRIVAILVSGSSSVDRMKADAKKSGRIVDATRGKKCRSILLADSGHLILSAIHPDTLSLRFETFSKEISDEGKEKSHRRAKRHRSS